MLAAHNPLFPRAAYADLKHRPPAGGAGGPRWPSPSVNLALEPSLAGLGRELCEGGGGPRAGRLRRGPARAAREDGGSVENLCRGFVRCVFKHNLMLQLNGHLPSPI